MKNEHNKSRPTSFDEFIWQEYILSTLSTAIDSARIRNKPLGHCLFAWASWYWKTTLAILVAHALDASVKIITWYAIQKPSELVSILSLLRSWDILFIDEIHRLKAPVEEVLYTAMEDWCIDMVMPDGHHIRLPIEPFTLIGATTKLESLSLPLKNRFVYSFYMQPYSQLEKIQLIKRYMKIQNISCNEELIIKLSEHISWVPRNITSLCIQLRDFLTSTLKRTENLTFNSNLRTSFWKWSHLRKWGIGPLHQRYLWILEESNWLPVWLMTLSWKLWINPKSIETDIEPLLFELGKIEITTRWRILIAW